MVKLRYIPFTCKHYVICHWFSLTDYLNILINTVFLYAQGTRRLKMFVIILCVLVICTAAEDDLEGTILLSFGLNKS